MSARARLTDPWTSMDAAMRVATQPLKSRVLYLFEEYRYPLTDEQLIALYRKQAISYRWSPASDSGIRSRRSELVDEGELIDTGRVEKTVSGRSTILWGLPWLLS
jgi:hypothetical protein